MAAVDPEPIIEPPSGGTPGEPIVFGPSNFTYHPDPIQLPIHPYIPSPGPIVTFIGQTAEGVWDDVWGWVRGNTGPTVERIRQIAGQAEQDAIAVSEAYTGTAIKALSGFFNNLGDYVTGGFESIAQDIDGLKLATTFITDFTQDQIRFLEHAITDVVMPDLGMLFRDVVNVASWTGAAIHFAVANANQWGIDHIYDPLHDEIGRVGIGAELGIKHAIEQMTQYTNDAVRSEALQRAEQIAPLLALARSTAQWVDDCGAPMCEQLGPKTDWSKLFKLLNAASMIALIAALATLRESDIESLAQTVVALAEGDAEAFVNAFVHEGETLAGALGGALGQLVP